jgi:hypothetical protein
MKKNIVLILIIYLLVGLNSCDKSEDCKTSDLVVKNIESEYGCPDTRYGLQIAISNDFFIIRSQQDFENKVTGSCSPKINFSSYDLVIGKKGLSSGNSSINYKLTKDCSNILKLLVTFNQSETMNAPNITYHALIPKLGDEETVKVEFVYN